MKRTRIVQVIVSIVTAACVVALSGCSGYPSVQEAEKALEPTPVVSAPTVKTDGVLTIGINSSNAPYAWAPDSGSSVIQGVDVDVALALAEQMGLTARFVNVGTTVTGASTGAVDVVVGVSPAQITDGLSVVVGSYADAAPAVFMKGAAAGTVATLDEIIAGPTGVQSDSASSKTLAEMAPTAPQQGFATLNDAFDALEAGTVKYVVCDSFMGGYLADSYDDIELVGALQMPTTRGVAVAAGNGELQTAVQSALDTLASNGVQDLIRTSWVGDLPAISASNQIAVPAPAPAPVEPAPAEGEGGEGEPAPEEQAE